MEGRRLGRERGIEGGSKGGKEREGGSMFKTSFSIAYRNTLTQVVVREGRHGGRRRRRRRKKKRRRRRGEVTLK